MVAAGYDPCIPRDAYQPNSSSCFHPRGGGVMAFDSFYVKQRREAAVEEWLHIHPDKTIDDVPYDEIDDVVYDNFPRSDAEFAHGMKRLTIKTQALPVGTFIIYPGLGTCKILEHNWFGNGALGGTYTLKVLKTGETVTHVRIGDEKIRKQGQ